MTTEEEFTNKQDGDLHDGDTGEYLFTIESGILPTSLDILKDGYWYHFTLAGKMEDTETETEEPTSIPDSLEPESELLANQVPIDKSSINIKDL